MKKKIAVIGLKGLPAFGGAATVGENIIEQLKDKYDFTVYSVSSHTSEKTGNRNGYKQIVFKKIPFKKINTLYYYIISAFHILFSSKYDIIHLHHRDAAFIIPFLKLRTKKVVLTIHGFGTNDLSDKWNRYKWFYDLQEKYFVKKADSITTMSLRDKNIIESKLNVHVDYIPNGINLQPQREKNKSENYIMFAAGRIVSFKRCDVFLKALKLINYTGAVKIVGDIEQSIAYKEYLLKLSEGLNVEYTGLIYSKDKLFDLYSNANFFVFPSSTEAMSMVLLEVASMGTPIICSDIPGNTQVFDSNEVLFFKTDDVEDLASKIKFAITNHSVMDELSNSALKKLNTNYRWDIVAGLYSDTYESCN